MCPPAHPSRQISNVIKRYTLSILLQFGELCIMGQRMGNMRGVSLQEIVTSVPRPRQLRSAITNDPLRLPGVSMRGLLGRRFRDLVSDLAAELGGVDRLGVIDLALVRGAAMDLMRQEEMSAALMRGEAIAHEELTRASNSARSALTKLGIKRGRAHAKRTPTVLEHIAARDARAKAGR
jgi:hypothetical protein